MIAGEQQTKTKAALEFCMAQLHAGDTAGAAAGAAKTGE